MAYIAGFLDGDGSLMLQLKKRKDGKQHKRFMSTICFYQDSRHELPLYWIRNILGIGYITQRNDGMTELRINGFLQVKEIMKQLLPFLRFKKDQAEALLEANKVLSQKSFSKLEKAELLQLVEYMMTIQKGNYASRAKKSRADLFKILDLTP
ncbi:MAG: LAGLIDADG family homing endonuclease [bacterium]|nr:LAGLIDADG family homing endonuclease [bacterium]